MDAAADIVKIDWANVAGPVALAYETSRAPVSVIVGPTGGGKSQASARKVLRVALMQEPSPRDGWRKARITCVAPTYRILWDTAIRSFRKVFPDSLGGKFKGSQGDPADYTLNIDWLGVGPLHIEVEFRALRDESAEEFVRGREVTAWWFPEMDTMPADDLLSLALNRVGRYPEPDDRPPWREGQLRPYSGLFGDANAPVVGSWFHQRLYIERQNADGFFRQPPALTADGKTNPAAENLHNLLKIDPEYYPQMASRMADYDVGRLLMCKPGYSRFGKPVHEHFDDQRHVAKAPLPIEPGLKVNVGADMGNTLKPAATFSQRTFSGQKRVLREISPIDRQMDLVEFARDIVRVLDTDFADCDDVEVTVDPSAIAKTTGNRTISYAQQFQAELTKAAREAMPHRTTGRPRERRIAVKLARTNDPGQRRTAVDQMLKRSAGPGEPALILCPKGVPQLIAGLSGGYRFKKNGDAYSPQPEKNDHSHEAEALQYDVLGSEGLSGDGGVIPPRASFTQSVGVIL